MYHHGPSLFPGDIPPELSRGHPLLCVSSYGLAAKYLGFNREAMHGLSIFISMGVLYASYLLGKRLFSPLIGLSNCLLMAFQPLFMAQSTMVLPEVMLALFTLLALLSYLQEKKVLYFLFASCALLTKESAVVLPFSLAAGEALLHLLQAKKGKALLQKTMVALLPYLSFALFLIVQKWQLGWFFFPFHTGLVSFAWEDIRYRGAETVLFLFHHQGKVLWLIPLSILSFHCWKMLQRRQVLPKEDEHTLLLIVFAAGGIAFSFLNTYLARYLMYVLPVLCLLCCLGIRYAVWFRPSFLLPIVVAMGATQVLITTGKTFAYDDDLSYKHIINAHIEAVDYLEKTYPKNTKIYANFPACHALEDPTSGYLHGTAFSNIVSEERPVTEKDLLDTQLFVIYNRPDFSPASLQKDLTLAKSFSSSFAQVGIYIVKPQKQKP